MARGAWHEKRKPETFPDASGFRYKRCVFISLKLFAPILLRLADV